jgi:C4-dicarboxylate-specific signal transduction histidine kinase
MLQMEPIPDDIKIHCQEVPISQVLINLIGNSCDAIQGQKDKWIKISAEIKDENVFLSVTDSGNGIPALLQEKIFQPFFTTKAIGQGTGLGLSISKGIINSQNGNLTLDTQCKNTKFVIQLPKSKAA